MRLLVNFTRGFDVILHLAGFTREQYSRFEIVQIALIELNNKNKALVVVTQIYFCKM